MRASLQAADMVGENDGNLLVLAAGKRRLCTGLSGTMCSRDAFTCLTSQSSVGQMQRYVIDGCVSNVGRRRNLCLRGVGSCMQERDSVSDEQEDVCICAYQEGEEYTIISCMMYSLHVMYGGLHELNVVTSCALGKPCGRNANASVTLVEV